MLLRGARKLVEPMVVLRLPKPETGKMSKTLKLLLALTIAGFVAGCDANQTEGEAIARKSYHSAEGDIGYAQVVKTGKTIYLSGITSGKETFEEQLKSIYGRIQKILGEYNADTDAIVKEVIYTRDIEALKAAIPIRKSYFKEGEYPSATWVQVERLYSGGHLLEVEIVAQLP